MSSAFKAAMVKLATVGHDPSTLIDCSEVIPVPPPFTGPAMFPAGLTNADVEQAVSLGFCVAT